MSYNFFKKIIFSILILFLFLTGCRLKQPDKNMLKDKKILMVVAPQDFRDEEYNEPRKIFSDYGITVKVASIQKGVAKGMFGSEVKIDLNAGEANPNNFDAVVFVGGAGMEKIKNDESLQILAQKFYQAGKITAAICAAPSVLAKAGILSGKNATSYSGSQKDLIDGGARLVSQDVVKDGIIITGSGPAVAREFGEKITTALSK